MQDIQTVKAVYERDIDLLLLEEFNVSKEFVSWFIDRVAMPVHGPITGFRAWHSLNGSSLGESDLVLTVECGGKAFAILVENKIDAPVQKDQGKRYRDRGVIGINEENWGHFKTCMVAPRLYLNQKADAANYDANVSYEEIAEWLTGHEGNCPRSRFRAYLIREAIEKNRRGYQPEIHAPTTSFWQSYWALARDLAPELEMAEPRSKPSRSGFIYFRPPSLPKGVDIVHKFNHECVDLQLRGMGKRLDEVSAVLGPYFDRDMTPVRATKSAAIRVPAPKLNANLSMAEQELSARAGIDTAKRLLTWFLTHKEAWLSYSENAKT